MVREISTNMHRFTVYSKADENTKGKWISNPSLHIRGDLTRQEEHEDMLLPGVRYHRSESYASNCNMKMTQVSLIISETVSIAFFNVA